MSWSNATALTRRATCARRAGQPGAIVIGGDYQGLGIARSLGRRGIPVCVVDDEPAIARASRYVTAHLRVPGLRSDTDTLDALDTARQRFGLDGWVVFPTRDETVAALSRHRDALAARFLVPTPPWPTVRVCWDKRETYRVAAALAIPHPRTWMPHAADHIGNIDAAGPFVVKPAIKEHFFYATGAKAWRADTREELAAAYRRAADVCAGDEVVIQELVPGGGEQQYSYCALVADGRAVASMTVRRLRQHPSDFGRASTFVETVDEPEPERSAMRFLSSVGYHGLVEVEFKRDPRDGAFKLLDVNARTWGYHSLGAAAGVDFPHLLFRQQTGAAPPEVALAARPGVRWIRLATDLPNAARDVAAGRLRTREYLRSLRGVHTEAVFAARDPLPSLYEVALLPSLAIRRGL